MSGINYIGPIEGLESCHDFGDIKIHAHRFARESEHITLYATRDGGIAATFSAGVCRVSKSVADFYRVARAAIAKAEESSK